MKILLKLLSAVWLYINDVNLKFILKIDFRSLRCSFPTQLTLPFGVTKQQTSKFSKFFFYFVSACSISFFYPFLAIDNTLRCFMFNHLSSVGALNLKNKSQQLHNNGRISDSKSLCGFNKNASESEWKHFSTLPAPKTIFYHVFVLFTFFFISPNYPRDPFLHVKSRPFSTLMLSPWFISSSRCWPACDVVVARFYFR